MMSLQEQINEYVTELSNDRTENSDNVELFIKKLGNIYREDESFRHKYSSFFPIICEIDKKRPSEGLDILAENLQKILDVVEKNTNLEEYSEHSTKSIFKLCDHLLLEIGRYNQHSLHDVKFCDLDKQYKELDKERHNIEKTLEKLGQQPREQIAILGIFSAIVISFAGGMNYLNSAIYCLSKVGVNDVALIAAIVGAVLLSVLCFLFHFIQSIVEKKDNKWWYAWGLVIFLVGVLLGGVFGR